MGYKNVCFPILLFVLVLSGCKKDYIEIMAVTGATPLALNESIPSGIELGFDGMVKRNYVFSGDALKALAASRVRVEEIDTEGKFLGTYAYTGIPLHNLLEGIAPSPLNKKEKSVFDRLKFSLQKKLSIEKPDEYPFHPSDILVTLYGRNGRAGYFSYGELVFGNDGNRVLLAYHRKGMTSGREPEKYTKNIYKDNIKGLRLVCPDDPDTSRYLDDVVKIQYSTMPAPDAFLPRVRSFKEAKSGKKCFSETITCIDGNKLFRLNLKEYSVKKANGWVRYSHGHGFQSISSAEGISFRDILLKNFGKIEKNDFFLIAGCDGYRSLASSREIFDNEDDENFLLVTKLDGGLPPGRIMFSSLKDFYADRDVWGVTNIVRLRSRE